MTQFENAQQQVLEGKITPPTVSANGEAVNYFGYQLAVHKMNLSLMAKGIGSRGIKLKDLKQYYGLKGRTASDCLEQFLKIQEEYLSKF